MGKKKKSLTKRIKSGNTYIKQKLNKEFSFKFKTDCLEIDVHNHDIFDNSIDCSKEISKEIGNVINLCKNIEANVKAALENENEKEINVFCSNITKKIKDSLIDSVCDNFSVLKKENKISSEKFSISFKYKGKESHITYHLYNPTSFVINDEKKFRQIVSFSEMMNAALDILRVNNRKIINSQTIKESNDFGIRNIERLFNFYKTDLRLTDRNTRRLISNRYKSCYGSSATFDSICKKYASQKDKMLNAYIDQVVLEGIARMTDTYVERNLNYIDGHRYFSYNLENSKSE